MAKTRLSLTTVAFCGDALGVFILLIGSSARIDLRGCRFVRASLVFDGASLSLAIGLRFRLHTPGDLEGVGVGGVEGAERGAWCESTLESQVAMLTQSTS